MNAFAGTPALIRLILRRDRIVLPIWIIMVGLVPIGIATSFAALYTTPEAIQAFADASMTTPATIALLGYVYAPTLGGLVAWRTGIQSSFLIVPVSILLVIRHTRTEEQTGRSDLIASTVVGRYASLTAALSVVCVANLLLGLLMAVGLISQGLPATGAFVLGLSAAAAGCVFAAVAAIAAQLTVNAGSARGIAFGVYAFAFMLRVAGDIGGETGSLHWLSWLSPVGWIRLTRAFADERWWVLSLSLILTVVLIAVAFVLVARRDLGAGLLPPSLGPANAAPYLSSPLGLAWRLHRDSLQGWAIAAVLFGLFIGSIGQSMTEFVDTPEFRAWLTGMGAQDAGDAFLFVGLYILGQIVSAYAIMTALDMRSQEMDGLAEAMLATPVSRLQWACSHLLFVLGEPTIAFVLLGLVAGLADGLGAGDVGTQLPKLFIRTMAALPAVWVVAGLTVALYGLLPRFATFASWGAFIIFLLLELGWELRQIGQSVFDISPFAHVHWATPIHTTSLIWLTIIAAALMTVGMIGLQRRDIGR